jgi:hypothetical protein
VVSFGFIRVLTGAAAFNNAVVLVVAIPRPLQRFIFKPTKAADAPFRTDSAGAASYFMGGDGRLHDEDSGFARTGFRAGLRRPGVGGSRVFSTPLSIFLPPSILL